MGLCGLGWAWVGLGGHGNKHVRGHEDELDACVSYSSESELYGIMCCLCVRFEYVSILVRLCVYRIIYGARFFSPDG